MSKSVERGGAKITQNWADHAPNGVHTIGDGLTLKIVEKNGKQYGSYILRAQVTGVRKDFAIGSSAKLKLADAKI